MSTEEFSIVPGFANYEISRTGIVRHVKFKRPLKPYLRKSGYYVVGLSVDGTTRCKLLHRLLGLTYLANPENHPGMNHKNGIKSDNRLENLEWLSQRNNVRHAYATGLAVKAKGRDHWWYKRHPDKEPGHRVYAPRPTPKPPTTMYFRGPSRRQSKFTDADVVRVFNLRAEGRHYREIASDLQISISAVHTLLHGCAWKSVVQKDLK